MAKKLSAWNIFVKKVYNENKHKPNYKFKDALKEASKRKGEMGSKSNTVKRKSKSSSKKNKTAKNATKKRRRKNKKSNKNNSN